MRQFSKWSKRAQATVLAVFGASALIAVPASAGVIVDFSGGATDLTNNFYQNQDNTVKTDFKFGATSGVQGGAGLSATGAALDGTLVYTPTKWTLTDGQTHTVSAFVTAVSGLAVGDKHLQIGFLNGANTSFNGENPPNGSFPNIQPQGFISARLLGDNELEFQTKAIGGGTVSSSPRVVPTGTITAGDFLKLTFSATETNVATGVFDLAFTLEDYGPTGAGVPVTNATGTLSGTSVPTLANTDLFAGFRTATPAGFAGTIGFDNFVTTGNGTPAPEPATLGLLAIGGIATLARRRR